MNTREILETAGLSKGMSDQHKETLASLAEKRDYSKGEVIVSEVNRSRDLFILAKGKISVTLQIPLGSGIIEVSESFRIGHVFGDVSFVDGSPRSATVMAESPSTVLLLPYESLVSLMEDDFEFGYRLMSNVASILADKVRNTTLAFRNLLL